MVLKQESYLGQRVFGWNGGRLKTIFRRPRYHDSGTKPA